VATLRRHFCDDDCNCSVALDPAGCANFSSSLRASFHFRDRVQYCTVVNNNDTDRNSLTLPKAPIPTGAARALPSCSILNMRWRARLSGRVIFSFSLESGFQKGAGRGRKPCDSPGAPPEAALSKPRPQNGKVSVGREIELMPRPSIRQPRIFSLALYKQSTSHLLIF
jgi:hypothetical protein